MIILDRCSDLIIYSLSVKTFAYTNIGERLQSNVSLGDRIKNIFEFALLIRKFTLKLIKDIVLSILQYISNNTGILLNPNLGILKLN